MKSQVKVKTRISSLFGKLRRRTTSSSTSIIPIPSNRVKKTTQSHPIQFIDQAHMMYAPYLDLAPLIAQYGLNHIVYTAVNKLAKIAASAEFMIMDRPDGMVRSHDHPLLALVGKFGRPNDQQDSFEFWEKHFQAMALCGNSYWFWDMPDRNGMPTELHLLEPQMMRIVPGGKMTIERYEYHDRGQQIPLSPLQITHFRRPSWFSRYYGLPPMIAQYPLVVGDNLMLEWNNDFFDDNLGLPSGIIIVSESTSDAEIQRIKAELIAEHGEARRVLVMKSDAGKAVWLDAALKRQDTDFDKGRESNRKGIFEANDIPLGVMADTSTEAHAIVSERRFMEAVRCEHVRVTRKLNVDGLDFWAQQQQWQTEFEDVRRTAVDWRREGVRRQVDGEILTIDEMRMKEHKMSPIDGETVERANHGKQERKQESSGDAGGST